MALLLCSEMGIETMYILIMTLAVTALQDANLECEVMEGNALVV